MSHSPHGRGIDSGADEVTVMLTDEVPGGVPVDPAAPQLLLSDSAVTRGDGVFESLLLRHGRIRALDDHLCRLAASADALALPIPDEGRWRSALDLVLDAVGSGPGEPEARITLAASRGPAGGAPSAWIRSTPVTRAESHGPGNALSVLTLDRGYPAGIAERAPWLLIGVKSLSYAVNLAAQRWARAHGADDAVFVSSDGYVLEGATSSVVLARDQAGTTTLLTPAAEAGLMAGTTQAACFRAGQRLGWECREAPLRVTDLFTARAVWLVSSVRMAAAVGRVDGRDIATDPVLHGQLTEALDREL